MYVLTFHIPLFSSLCQGKDQQSHFLHVILAAICKPSHWNLGIGIGIENRTGIGTHITVLILRHYFQFHKAYGSQI